MIIIPIKWLFHWEYTLFLDKPMYVCPKATKNAMGLGAELHRRPASASSNKARVQSCTKYQSGIEMLCIVYSPQYITFITNLHNQTWPMYILYIHATYRLTSPINGGIEQPTIWHDFCQEIVYTPKLTVSIGQSNDSPVYLRIFERSTIFTSYISISAMSVLRFLHLWGGPLNIIELLSSPFWMVPCSSLALSAPMTSSQTTALQWTIGGVTVGTSTIQRYHIDSYSILLLVES